MIIHIDLDCFFVSAARIKDPTLIGKKVAIVGGSDTLIFGVSDEVQNRGGRVILSASYEAREFGVRSAMPLQIAQNLCKDMVIVGSNHAFYREISNNLYKFLLSFTPDIERFSIDEFFLDLRGTKFDSSPLEFARNLQKSILENFRLPCSIGICEAKFVAKLATDLAKPFGIKMIENIKEIWSVDIGKFSGIGASSRKKLDKYSIKTIKDALDHREIFEQMGKGGIKIYNRISGTLDEGVIRHGDRKTIGFGRTFAACMDRDEIKRRILIMCRHLANETLNKGLNPATYELKIRYKTRDESSKRKSVDRAFSLALLSEISTEIFDICDIHKSYEIIHISLNLSNFKESKFSQNSLFFNIEDQKRQKLDTLSNQIWNKFGIDKLKKASEI